MAVTPKLTAMVYCRSGERILLIRRRKQPFEGQWIAPGGKIESGEAPWHAAARELQEETGLVVAPEDLQLRGIITETSPRPDWQWLMFVYVADRFAGELRETCPEGDLAWCERAALATLDIPEADRHFAGAVLDTKGVYQAWFDYDADLRLVEWIELRSL